MALFQSDAARRIELTAIYCRAILAGFDKAMAYKREHGIKLDGGTKV